MDYDLDTKSILFLTCGLPASGKSSWLNSDLHKFLNQCYDEDSVLNPIILCPDDFRMVLSGRDYFAPIEEIVWATVKTTARVQLLYQNRAVIIDATNLTIGSRRQWIQIAKDCGVPIECFYFDVPLEECMRRNKDRQRIVPQDVLIRMNDDTVIPTIEEGFDFIHEISFKDQY